ncbi:MAG TPA: bifunctional phosphoglucose/phosphomannose isomerase [Acidimicrobiia bacterium]|jgi:glucose/mannose-6-phosphate isomerase|nr:bifunctional phosphoglucose/phosphomannose isomerase [Acidimicrobiia bacterium]
MAVDSLGFGAALAGLPEQLAAAHEVAGKVSASALPDAARFDRIVMLGMGGSGIAGNVVQAVGTATLPVPVTVLKHYRTPAFVNERTLAFALSYSGDTEETVEMARGALAAGATLVAISSGGALAQLAEESGSLHVSCPDDILMPRLALGALVAPLVVVLFRMGMLPEAHAGLLRAQEQLARRRDQCQPAVAGQRNPARELARKIGRTIPIIYGSGGLGGVAALRWKQSMNENAKAPAFWNEYPELDHNEVCGWGQHGDVTRQVFTLVELRHGLEHPRLEARARATRELIEEALVQVLAVEAEGEGRLAQLLDLIYVGDWTSYYLALDNDVDPGPIDAISQLKSTLG